MVRLKRWAGGRLPSWARGVVDTDDLVQDTLVRTMSVLDGFEPRHDGALDAYIRQALSNRILDEMRRARRVPAGRAINEADRYDGPSPLEETVGLDVSQHGERAYGGMLR